MLSKENSLHTRANLQIQSRFLGVSWDEKKKAWRSTIQRLDGSYQLLGFFDTEEEAAKAYDRGMLVTRQPSPLPPESLNFKALSIFEALQDIARIDLLWRIRFDIEEKGRRVFDEQVRGKSQPHIPSLPDPLLCSQHMFPSSANQIIQQSYARPEYAFLDTNMNTVLAHHMSPSMFSPVVMAHPSMSSSILPRIQDPLPSQHTMNISQDHVAVHPFQSDVQADSHVQPYTGVPYSHVLTTGERIQYTPMIQPGEPDMHNYFMTGPFGQDPQEPWMWNPNMQHGVPRVIQPSDLKPTIILQEMPVNAPWNPYHPSPPLQTFPTPKETILIEQNNVGIPTNQAIRPTPIAQTQGQTPNFGEIDGNPVPSHTRLGDSHPKQILAPKPKSSIMQAQNQVQEQGKAKKIKEKHTSLPEMKREYSNESNILAHPHQSPLALNSQENLEIHASRNTEVVSGHFPSAISADKSPTPYTQFPVSHLPFHNFLQSVRATNLQVQNSADISDGTNALVKKSKNSESLNKRGVDQVADSVERNKSKRTKLMFSEDDDTQGQN